MNDRHILLEDIEAFLQNKNATFVYVYNRWVEVNIPGCKTVSQLQDMIVKICDGVKCYGCIERETYGNRQQVSMIFTRDANAFNHTGKVFDEDSMPFRYNLFYKNVPGDIRKVVEEL